MTPHYEVSVDELALAMSILGYPQPARSLLEATWGPLHEEEISGRLYAAGTSLAARSWLKVDPAGSLTAILEHQLGQIVQLLVRPAFTLRYDKGASGDLQTCAYHFASDRDLVVEHSVRQGIVHCFTLVAQAEIALKGINFFGIWPQTLPDVGMSTIPITVFDEVRSMARPRPTTAQRRLEQAGMDAGIAQMLVQDLRESQYQSSVLRIEYDAQGQPVSDRGFLILQGLQRAWAFLFRAEGDNALVSPLFLSPDVFQAEIKALLE